MTEDETGSAALIMQFGRRYVEVWVKGVAVVAAVAIAMTALATLVGWPLIVGTILEPVLSPNMLVPWNAPKSGTVEAATMRPYSIGTFVWWFCAITAMYAWDTMEVTQ